MLALIQRFLPQPKAALPSFDWLDAWAEDRKDELKQVRGQKGFVLSNTYRGRRMRIECGRSKRDYIEGNELRMLFELGVSSNLEMLILTRALADKLEKRTFESLTHHDQTDVTASLPEEARWLSMFERVDLTGLPPSLAKRFVVVASQPALARQWLEGDFSAKLVQATTSWLDADLPMVLMTLRGRFVVRTEAASLDDDMLSSLRNMAEVAALGAMTIHKVRSHAGTSRPHGPVDAYAGGGHMHSAHSEIPADLLPSDSINGTDELAALDEAIRNSGAGEMNEMVTMRQVVSTNRFGRGGQAAAQPAKGGGMSANAGAAMSSSISGMSVAETSEVDFAVFDALNGGGASASSPGALPVLTEVVPTSTSAS